MSSQMRKSPYTTSTDTWFGILNNNNIIPMNQRQYEWSNKEIAKFMNDIFDIFENTDYVEKMGTLIYYMGNPEGREVWDGQQRMITIILILISISKIARLYHNDIPFSDSIVSTISENLHLIDPNERIRDLIKKYGGDVKIPKICCIWPHDNNAIIDIYNTYNPLIYYNNKININNENIYHEEEEDDEEEEEENGNGKKEYHLYECKTCSNVSFSRKDSFVRHLSNKHNYMDKSKSRQTNTNVYNAYEFICETIIKKNYLLNRLKEIYRFISKEINIEVCKCDDLQYVSLIFDQENNRGIKVGGLDVIKNKILSNINDEKKDEIFNEWTCLKSSKHDVYTDYGQRIFNCAIQIYNNCILGKFNQEILFDNLINKNDKESTYIEIKKFISIVEKLITIMDEILKDRYGRLIFTKNCSIAWEGYMYLLLPIFYFKNTIDKRLIQLIVTWYYRNIGQNTSTFNKLCYSNIFIEISNKFIKNNTYDYYNEITNLLQKEKDDRISSENYVKNHINKEWKGTHASKAKMLLYFMQTKINTNDNLPILTHDLEHIHSDNKKNDLKVFSNVYKFGNLTLLEPTKSENGHKGNRSIKDSDYNIKKPEYKGSSHSITRDIYEEYNDFTEDSIINRTQKLFEKLNDLTNY